MMIRDEIRRRTNLQGRSCSGSNAGISGSAGDPIHELKANLGIDIQQINLAVSPMPHDTGTFRVVCTIVSLSSTEPLEIELTVRIPHDGVGTNGGTPVL
jgi:hypothetical protein